MPNVISEVCVKGKQAKPYRPLLNIHIDVFVVS